MPDGKFGHLRLQAAIFAASSFHLEQLDKKGVPYVLHPLRVMMAVKHLGIEAMIKAVLHDTVEDTDMLLEDVERGWGKEVRDALDALSRRKGGRGGGPEETYFDYVRRLAASPDPHVIAIKKADIEDNSDPSRAFDGELPSSSDASLSHSWLSLIRRYQKAIRIMDGLEQ